MAGWEAPYPGHWWEESPKAITYIHILYNRLRRGVNNRPHGKDFNDELRLLNTSNIKFKPFVDQIEKDLGQEIAQMVMDWED